MASHYHPLEDGSIRLLSILDESGLACSLQSYRLDKAPPYIALSYTWGRASFQKGRSSSLTYAITLNHEYFEVQQNLHDALRHLGHRVRKRSCLFWVDTICINQGDVDERSAQVKIMKDIYQRADTVFPWLGLPFDDEETRLAVELMREFYLYLSKGLEKHNIIEVIATVNKNHAGFPTDRTSQVWVAWDGIARMFNQAYWRRTWVHQEVTIPNHVLFFCGEHSFDGILLSATMSFGETFTRYPDFHVTFKEAAGPFSGVAYLWCARIARKKRRSQRLIHLVYWSSKTTCTDPRDKIYAPLGHAVDIAPNQIFVDYRKSLVDICIDFARYALFYPGLWGLEFLGLIFTPAEDASHKDLSMTFDPRMPSWLPDWRSPVIVGTLASSEKAMVDGLPFYDPCPGTQVEGHIFGEELELKGCLAGDLHIATLTTIWDDAEASLLIPRTWLNALLAANRARDGLDRAICRSLVGDRHRALHSIDHNDFTLVWERGGMVDWTLMDAELDQLDQISSENWGHVYSDMMVLCYGRRMAQFTDGRVAILPAAARTDDQVVAFHGGKCLYLIRPISDRRDAYSSIGECYVDGLMDGGLHGHLQAKGQIHKNAKTGVKRKKSSY